MTRSENERLARTAADEIELRASISFDSGVVRRCVPCERIDKHAKPSRYREQGSFLSETSR